MVKKDETKKFKKYSLIFFALIVPFTLTLVLVALYFFNIFDAPAYAQWIIFAIFIPLTIITLYVHQRNTLAGPYGETILILIPTFVWLLAGADSSIKWLIYMSGVLVAVGIMNLVIALFLSPESFLKRLLTKLTFVYATVVSTVIISIVLLNWGDKGVQLAGENHDYTSKPWIVFIAVVTVLSALLLIFIGLLSTFEKVNIDRSQLKIMSRKKVSKARKERDIALSKTQDVKLKKKQVLKKDR